MKNIALNSILNNNKSEHFFKGGFGFEKENVRVNLKGELSQKPHPLKFGNKRKHPYITTDFSESQIELITPVRKSIEEALGFLETLHDEVSMNLEDELLWPQSVPPVLPENDNEIPLAEFDDEGADLRKYREHLSEKYGRKKQLLSGIHFNISFDEELLKLIFESSDNTVLSFKPFREQVYLKTLRNFKRYRWFLLTLLGNSSVVHKSYNNNCVIELPEFGEDAAGVGHQISIRNSMCGYRNIKPLFLNYDSLENYKLSLKENIDSGLINYEKENYSSIRLKSSNPKEDLTHLEVRILDLNPLEKIGINIEHVKIIHLFLIFCLFKEEVNTFDKDTQSVALENHEQSTSNSSLSSAIITNDEGEQWPLQTAIEDLFKEIKQSISTILPSNYKTTMQVLEQLVHKENERPGAKVLAHYKEHSFIDWNLLQAQKHLELSMLTNYKFFGLEDMELSTQLLLREAVMRGVEIDIMDRSENFVKLFNPKKTEYVMQATRTSLDNYVSVLLMENKVMTKKVLLEHNISTPEGKEYYDKEEAFNDYKYFENKAVVIKPKSTNFGIGITILKENNNKQQFLRAIDIAFEHDNTILIEKFISGNEYRMFVIKDEVVGVLNRVPANVKGDGKLSIEELVVEKNKNPLRGKGYRTPLEKIALGEAEQMFLGTQGLDFTDVPAKSEIVYLRENSNISTGGDSLDFTDDIHPSYKNIAIKASRALNVNITGLDMMIDDISSEATKDNYSIIEMNFNPAIHIHCHPFKGTNRKLNHKILDALGFFIEF